MTRPFRKPGQQTQGEASTKPGPKIRTGRFRRAYDTFKRLVLAVFGLAILLVLLELLTRIADYAAFGAPVLRNYNEESLFTVDVLGRRGRPFARYRKWQLNSLGYRGPEIEKDKIHIICIGSSETFGLYEAPHEEYPRQLERLLNSTMGREIYQVVNVSYPGETLNTARVRIPEIVSIIHPQYAVIYPSVTYYIWLPWTVHSPPSPNTATRFQQEHFEWRIAEEIHDETKQYLAPAVQNWLRECQNRWDARKFGIELDHVPDENIARMKSDLTRFVVGLRAHGVQPVLVTHASRFGAYLSKEDRYLLTAWRRSFPMMREDGFMDTERRMNEGIREVAALEDVPLIDAATKMPKGAKYFADYQHFTTMGARAMAEILAGGLLPLLQSRSQGGRGGAAPASASSGGVTLATIHSTHATRSERTGEEGR